jgi:hypothetical protein
MGARSSYDLVSIRLVSGSGVRYRTPTSAGQRCKEKATLLTALKLT